MSTCEHSGSKRIFEHDELSHTYEELRTGFQDIIKTLDPNLGNIYWNITNNYTRVLFEGISDRDLSYATEFLQFIDNNKPLLEKYRHTMIPQSNNDVSPYNKEPSQKSMAHHNSHTTTEEGASHQ